VPSLLYTLPVFNSHSMLFHFTRDRWFHFQVINIGEEKGEISTQILLCLPGKLIRARTPRSATRSRSACIFSLARRRPLAPPFTMLGVYEGSLGCVRACATGFGSGCVLRRCALWRDAGLQGVLECVASLRLMAGRLVVLRCCA
jgi:hypothetical protein